MKQYNNVTMNNSGFTIIELLTVISIVTILSATAVVSYNSMRTQFSLLRSAHQLSQEIRKVQEMATSSREVSGVVPEGGFGIYLNISGAMVLFADFNNNGNYDSGSEKLEDITLEQGVIICNLTINPLKIIFQPPNPKVNISGVSPAGITLCLENDILKTKSIQINGAGLIYVE